MLNNLRSWLYFYLLLFCIKDSPRFFRILDHLWMFCRLQNYVHKIYSSCRAVARTLIGAGYMYIHTFGFRPANFLVISLCYAHECFVL